VVLDEDGVQDMALVDPARAISTLKNYGCMNHCMNVWTLYKCLHSVQFWCFCFKM
jgi:hypothetical protein